MPIDRIDHIVLTVRDLEATIRFYTENLGLEAVEFEPGRHALHIGDAKLNLHRAGDEFAPHADRPTPGSADLCFTTTEPILAIVERLERAGVPVEVGPVGRVGARSGLRSIYLRDPDGNLIEVAN